MSASLNRRAAAVMAVDIVGYSRLMHLEEERTHQRVMRLLEEAMAGRAASRGGRVVKKTGDGGLLEFPNVVEATRCGVEIQEEVPRHNDGYPADRHLAMRIGINFGDIIIEDDDIYGDGVNIAARLESLARPGSICVSDAVVAQIADKFAFAFEDMGYQQLKNIAKPIRAFIIDTRPSGVADADDVAFASRPVPGFEGRPAIAVLPFAVGGRDDDDAMYLGDGVAEELIDLLASWRAFPVIARNSSFQFRDAVANPRLVGVQLGARYLVCGSIRRAGNRVRVAAQLLEAGSGAELLSHRVECAVDDLFRAQVEIAEAIGGELEPELMRVERERAIRRPTTGGQVYDHLMRGQWHHYRFTAEHTAQAQEYLRLALAADPLSAQAHAALSISITLGLSQKWNDDGEAGFEAAFRLARRGVELDPRDPFTQFALGASAMWTGRNAEAESAMDEAMRLNPSHAAAYALNCFLKTFRGAPAEGLESGLKALRLSPHDPRLSLWLPGVAAASFHLGRFEEAISYGLKALARRPGYGVPLRYVVASLGWLGRAAEAAPFLAELREAYPDLASVEGGVRRRGYRDEAALAQLLEGLTRAGFS